MPLIGRFLGSFIGLGKVESLDLGGIPIATFGTILHLLISRIVKKPKA